MKLKHLESSLSSLDCSFPAPKVYLEQYNTPASLAARVVWTSKSNGDLSSDSHVVDLGCGTGMLGIACVFAMEGWCTVTAVDLDADAMEKARNNVEEMNLMENFNFVRARVRHHHPSSTGSRSDGTGDRSRKNARGKVGKGRAQRSLKYGLPSHVKNVSANINTFLGRTPLESAACHDGVPLMTGCADLVFVNPPFGTKNNHGIDMSFLAVAARLSSKAVYSFHKSSTRKYIAEVVTRDWRMGHAVVAEMRFEIPASYDFHRCKCVDVEVDLVRIWHLGGEDNKQECDETQQE
mmetsp:Transcript_14181/g.31004  ORF Transcript_14181/g.31004 Transcript_14181/m.31004 type:complete len:293 (-) Transcript_14181:255-1133(-)|eukprot:CAMPEP_0113297508 /NCGR_PEP_ID=MMETSP0010_2-20120614/338_1 /TAXON_ID=216773 ORGANISM="Corethron hystrix, Strain 308" /NCGR_SAMPLE_ID=MMETSP0010_2 /ASSEMBLY_ACC=CAM_ASM_000155 /LENGTH=292 /DNA_ID=CAMNT_0000150403 /DNA_START=13 /DNA_END=891 /DNA_ORIENTATION=+ /assembly_acc=CAM_ASM_000155